MKLMILITGVQYQCRDEYALGETLEHLKADMPEMCLVRKTMHDYGVVVEAREGRSVQGVVGRLDILDVLEMMRLKGYGALKSKVARVSMNGAWFEVEVDTPEGFVSKKMAVDEKWAKWALPDIPLMADIPGHSDLESTVSYLEAALHCSDEFDVVMTVEYLRDLMTMIRYDVTIETQEALRVFRRLVDASGEPEVRGMIDELVRSINDLGSQKREEEFEEMYWQMLSDSDEATDMINAWYSSFAYTKADDMTLEDIRRQKLRDIEHSLQTLPDDLYREIDRKGKLHHLLLYKGIPYEKYRALMSALIMRDHLLDELETVMEYENDDDNDTLCYDNDDDNDSAEHGGERNRDAEHGGERNGGRMSVAMYGHERDDEKEEGARRRNVGNGGRNGDDNENRVAEHGGDVAGAYRFGFIIYRHHSKTDIDAAMERLNMKCQGKNSRALMRTLIELDKEGYIDISDVSAKELYTELVRVFGVPKIKHSTFAESYRLIG